MSYVEPLLAPLVGFSWKEESSYRTRPTNIDNWLKVTKQTIPWPDRETEEVHAAGTGFEPNYVNDEMKQKMEGNFTYEIIDAMFLPLLLGQCVTTDETTYYTHTITVKKGLMPSFATQIPFEGSPDVISEFLGNRVDKITFRNSDDSEKLMGDVDYLSAKPVDGSVVETVTKTSDPPKMFKQGVFSSTSLYTGAKARIFGFELPVSRNCKGVYAGGYEHWPYDIVPGKLSYGELKLIVGLEGDTEWNEVLATPGTVHDWEYEFTRATNDLIRFSGSAKFKGAPPTVDEHDVRATLTLIPSTLTIYSEDQIPLYPGE